MSATLQLTHKTIGVEVRRGTAVTGLIGGASASAGVPHVTGVRTKAGEVIMADLVVDMSGRRSALPDWLEDIGARRPGEELEDSGFVYYGRQTGPCRLWSGRP